METAIKNLLRVVPVTLLLVLAACNPRGMPIQNIEEAPLNGPPDVSLEEVKRVIVQSGVRRNWQMVEKEPGHIVATVSPRTHSATVDVKFDTDTFSIIYVTSTNLNYDGINIHKNYIHWIRKLRNDIQKNMLNLK